MFDFPSHVTVLALVSVLLTAGLGFEAGEAVADSSSSSSFSRSGTDQLSSASLTSGAGLNFTYDESYGHVTGIADVGESGFSLSLESDALLHLPLSQTVIDQESGNVLLSTTITYDVGGLRARRLVSAGSEGEGSSTTSYWYGGSLHPLVITRDGVNYLLIGKQVVEQTGSAPTRSYIMADRLGSVRVVTNDRGEVVESIGYVGDYGATRIGDQSYSASDDDMASCYRFQGQEQETLPLAKLGIEDDALATWLDQLQLYHFPWRDYAAGLAVFTETDPIPAKDSLYAALGANPVNFTDETGGMDRYMGPVDDEKDGLDDEEDEADEADERGGMGNGPPEPGPFYLQMFRRRHRVAQLISEEAEDLLDQLRADPYIGFTQQQWKVLTDLYNEVLDRYNNPNGPFRPYAAVYDGLFEFGVLPPAYDQPSQAGPDLADRFRKNLTSVLNMLLRDEQQNWLFFNPGPLIVRMRNQVYDEAIWPERVRSNPELDFNDWVAAYPFAVDTRQRTSAAARNDNVPQARANAAASTQDDDLVERSEQREEEETAGTGKTKGKDIGPEE